MIIVLQIECIIECTNFEYILDKIMCHLVKFGVHSILKETLYFNYVILLEKNLLLQNDKYKSKRRLEEGKVKQNR